MKKIESLIENIDNQIIKIRTKNLDISFNEMYDMYQNGELIISPEYQRLFRWEEDKQSRFIESLILEMPVPPIFVIERQDGIYELIDGLQRISSYLHYRGEEIDTIEESDESYTENKSKRFKLIGCDIVPELNGLIFDELPKALQIKLKRSFIRMEVIKKESETTLKYHMFKRLNTGGELLSAQEIRNCTIRLLGSKGIDFIDQCANDENFKSVIKRIGKDKFKRKYDQELVLRFFAIKNDLENYKYPVTEYLTRYLEKITDKKVKFNYTREYKTFSKTFKFINDCFGEEAFSGKAASGTMRNEFVLYYYDGIAVSIAKLIDDINLSNDSEHIINCINKIKFGSDIRPFITGSLNGIKNRIRIFTEGMEKILGSR